MGPRVESNPETFPAENQNPPEPVSLTSTSPTASTINTSSNYEGPEGTATLSLYLGGRIQVPTYWLDLSPHRQAGPHLKEVLKDLPKDFSPEDLKILVQREKELNAEYGADLKGYKKSIEQELRMLAHVLLAKHSLIMDPLAPSYEALQKAQSWDKEHGLENSPEGAVAKLKEWWPVFEYGGGLELNPDGSPKLDEEGELIFKENISQDKYHYKTPTSAELAAYQIYQDSQHPMPEVDLETAQNALITLETYLQNNHIEHPILLIHDPSAPDRSRVINIGDLENNPGLRKHVVFFCETIRLIPVEYWQKATDNSRWGKDYLTKFTGIVLNVPESNLSGKTVRPAVSHGGYITTDNCNWAATRLNLFAFYHEIGHIREAIFFKILNKDQAHLVRAHNAAYLALRELDPKGQFFYHSADAYNGKKHRQNNYHQGKAELIADGFYVQLELDGASVRRTRDELAKKHGINDPIVLAYDLYAWEFLQTRGNTGYYKEAEIKDLKAEQMPLGRNFQDPMNLGDRALNPEFLATLGLKVEDLKQEDPKLYADYLYLETELIGRGETSQTPPFSERRYSLNFMGRSREQLEKIAQGYLILGDTTYGTEQEQIIKNLIKAAIKGCKDRSVLFNKPARLDNFITMRFLDPKEKELDKKIKPLQAPSDPSYPEALADYQKSLTQEEAIQKDIQNYIEKDLAWPDQAPLTADQAKSLFASLIRAINNPYENAITRAIDQAEGDTYTSRVHRLELLLELLKQTKAETKSLEEFKEKLSGGDSYLLR